MRILVMVMAVVLAIVAGAQAGTITLAWDASSGADGYVLHYGLASGNYTQAVDAGPATSVALSGLTDGETYYFAALAYNSTDNSGYSNEVSQLITPPSPTDTTRPMVSVTSPTDGATIQRKSTITITATASDNVGVVRVVFLVNGNVHCTDLSAPYSCQWNVPNQRRTYQLQVHAFDQAGNEGVGSVVGVTAQ